LLENLTFDTEPILALFFDELGAKTVADLLNKVLNSNAAGYINVVNLTEIYYTLARHSARVAEEKVELLRSFGLKIVPVEDNGLWRRAAILKNRHLLPLGDAYAVATAQATKSKPVIGADKELSRLNIPLIKLK